MLKRMKDVKSQSKKLLSSLYQVGFAVMQVAAKWFGF